MHTFAQKPKVPKQQLKSTKLFRSPSGQSRDVVRSILYMQRTIGNHAVQRLLQSKTGDPEENTVANARSGLDNDFSRIPVYGNRQRSRIPVGPFFTKRGKELTQKDIDIATGFNFRYTWLNRRNILGHHIGKDYTYTSDFEEALAMGISNWQEKLGGLRIDGQLGWNSLARLVWILIRNGNYSNVSDAIKIVVDGLGYRVAKIKYIVYNPKLIIAYKVISAGKIEIGRNALKSYTAFRLTLRNAIQMARKSPKPEPVFKPKPSGWKFVDKEFNRKKLEKFTKSPSTYNCSKLSWEHSKFVNWSYSPQGENAIAFLTYLVSERKLKKPYVTEGYQHNIDRRCSN